MKMERKRKGNSSSSALKVVYISSPMKVKTTPSRFRALVQQLTGKDSDITKSMDIVENWNNFIDINLDNAVDPPQKGISLKLSESFIPDNVELQYFSSPPVVGDSPSSSESLIEQQEVSGDYLEKSLSPNEEEEEEEGQYQELKYFSLPVEEDRIPWRDSDSPSSSFESVIEQQQQGGGFGYCEAFLSSQEAEDQFLEDVFTSSLFFEQYSQSHLLDTYDAL